MKKKVTIIGLTGSIAMGKSVTAKMFERANIPVFDSDKAVHILLASNEQVRIQVEKIFPGVTGPQGIDRNLLGKKVFGNQQALKKHEAIIHPKVSDMRQEFLDRIRMEGRDMAVIDVPLLFETGADKQCDYTVVVSASDKIQRQRVMARPHMTAQKFNDIKKQQMPDMEKRRRADFIIQSDYGFEFAERQVGKIIGEIRKKSDA